MNCKPGDLAVVVGTSSINAGRFVTVIEIDNWVSRFLKKPVWRATSNSPLQTEAGTWTTEGWVEDDHLRPIRDPGEDATDEMVLRVGKPVEQPEGVSA